MVCGSMTSTYLLLQAIARADLAQKALTGEDTVSKSWEVLKQAEVEDGGSDLRVLTRRTFASLWRGNQSLPHLSLHADEEPTMEN